MTDTEARLRQGVMVAMDEYIDVFIDFVAEANIRDSQALGKVKMPAFQDALDALIRYVRAEARVEALKAAHEKPHEHIARNHAGIIACHCPTKFALAAAEAELDALKEAK